MTESGNGQASPETSAAPDTVPAAPPQPSTCSMPVAFVQKLASYLQTKPYNEVAPLLMEMQGYANQSGVGFPQAQTPSPPAVL